MYKSIPILIISLFLYSPSIGNENVIYQQPTPAPTLAVPEPIPVPILDFSYEVHQASFLSAKSAKVFTTDTGVLIEVQELSKEIQKGIVVYFVGILDTTVEVTTLLNLNGVTVGTFPPRYVKPSEHGTYQITGNSGDKFGIRVTTKDGPRHVLAEIAGTPTPPTDPPPVDPPDPPPTDLSDITKLVSVAATTLNDPITQEHIKIELAKLLSNFPDDISLAKSALKNAISSGLLESMPKVVPPYKDWKNGLRIPLDKEIEKLAPSTTSQLKSIVEAIHKGL